MAVSIDASVRIGEDVAFRELDGEAVVLNLRSGIYFGLDAVGTRIWQLCQERGSLRAVWAAMHEEFDVSPEDLRADLLAFVEELASRELITVQ
jgi:hypothetical protein